MKTIQDVWVVAWFARFQKMLSGSSRFECPSWCVYMIFCNFEDLPGLHGFYWFAWCSWFRIFCPNCCMLSKVLYDVHDLHEVSFWRLRLAWCCMNHHDPYYLSCCLYMFGNLYEFLSPCVVSCHVLSSVLFLTSVHCPLSPVLCALSPVPCSLYPVLCVFLSSVLLRVFGVLAWLDEAFV